MNAIEAEFESLSGQLPKDYDRFDDKLLEICSEPSIARVCARPRAICSGASMDIS
jgi:hypothetical protein